MTESLGSLIGSSFRTFQEILKPILVCAVIFALIFAGMETLLLRKVGGAMMGGDSSKFEEMGEVLERMRAGDEAAVREYTEIFGEMGMLDAEGKVSGNATKGFLMGFLRKAGPSLIAFTIISALLSVAAGLYYLIAASRNSQDVGAIARRVPSLYLPMLGVAIMTFVLSFAWIPLIGIFLAIYFAPRVALSGPILVSEGMGAVESIRMSWRRTRGHWWKAFSNLLVVAIILGVISLVVNMVVAAVTSSLPLLATIIGQFVGQMVTAFMMIFLLRLSATLRESPKAAVATA